jgi:hypothetical protein
VEDVSVPISGDGLHEIESSFGPPAYVRRARRVQDAFDALLGQCRREREARLEMVRTRLGLLHALSGGWDAVRPFLADDEQAAALQRLHTELAPKLRDVVQPTSSPWALRRALRELGESIERFNRLWREFLGRADVRGVNELRDGYNRYYLLEKECALRSPRLARLGYQPLEPLTTAELESLMPPLPLLRFRKKR